MIVYNVEGKTEQELCTRIRAILRAIEKGRGDAQESWKDHLVEVCDALLIKVERSLPDKE